MRKDPNGFAMTSLTESFSVVESDPGTFAGATTDARGNDGGAKDGAAIFTVTGDVLVRIFGVCGTLLAGASATIEVGVTGNTAALIAQTTATNIDANEVWNDATPGVGTDTLANLTGPHIIVNDLDILETIATADITSGELRYVCLWAPLSSDGNVVPA